MASKNYDLVRNLTEAELSTRTALNYRYGTELEQLMVLAPGDVPLIEPIKDTAGLKEAIGEAVDNLSLEDREIFNFLFIAGLSLRVSGAALGIPKTSLARRRDKIRRMLMLDLVFDERVREWVYRDFNLHTI
tara:strand:- start:486 stop:881 length:396 start_codon:yes stop_codon:yes gene_type:complete